MVYSHHMVYKQLKSFYMKDFLVSLKKELNPRVTIFIDFGSLCGSPLSV